MASNRGSKLDGLNYEGGPNTTGGSTLHPLLAALTKIYWLAPVDSEISRIAREALLRGL